MVTLTLADGSEALLNTTPIINFLNKWLKENPDKTASEILQVMEILFNGVGRDYKKILSDGIDIFNITLGSLTAA